MTILEEVLLEEYERCQKSKRTYKSEQKELSRDSERYKQLQKAIRRANQDLRTLRRALGVLLLPKWRRWVETHRKY